MHMTHMNGLRSTMIEVYRNQSRLSLNLWGKIPTIDKRHRECGQMAVVADKIGEEFGETIDPANWQKILKEESAEQFRHTVACVAGWYAIMGQQVIGQDNGIDFSTLKKPGLMEIWCEHFDIPMVLANSMFMPGYYAAPLDGRAISIEDALLRIEFNIKQHSHLTRTSDKADLPPDNPSWWHDQEKAYRPQFCLNTAPDGAKPCWRHPDLLAIDRSQRRANASHPVQENLPGAATRAEENELVADLTNS